MVLKNCLSSMHSWGLKDSNCNRYCSIVKTKFQHFTITVMQSSSKFHMALECSHPINCKFVSRHSCWMVRLSNKLKCY